MRKFLITLLAVAVVFAMVLPTLAAKPNVQHFDAKFNIIGHPKNVDVLKNDAANGTAIFVPLKNANRDSLQCAFEGDAIVNEPAGVVVETVEPVGAKIYFVYDPENPKFDILDRDATDADGATIQVPEPGTWTIYLRVLGKPYQCMNINAYAYDLDQNLWFYAGSVYLSRKVGQNNNNTSWISTKDLFDVNFCQVVSVGPPVVCAPGSLRTDLSVFDDVFESYFWNILNDGTRIVQARLVKN